MSSDMMRTKLDTSAWHLLKLLKTSGMLLFLSFLPTLEAQQPLKVVNGRIKEVVREKQGLVLSYQNPVTEEWEELTLQVDERSGFQEGIQLEDLREGEPVTVDYEDRQDGIGRIVLVKRVPLRGVPEEISR